MAPPRVSEVETARRRYPPFVTAALLAGDVPSPEGFDGCIADRLGQQRLRTLRSEAEMARGEENDAAAVCLMRLGVPPESLEELAGGRGQPPRGALPPPMGVEQVTVEFTGSTYRAARGGTSGFFKTGQDADIMLSGIDFNDAGGPLLFNHPGGIASDGVHLLLADRNNNRVLIWNELPQGNVAPDVVLGQRDFRSNNPGTGRNEMNWPVSVATDGEHIVVADTENYRILIWNSFPVENGVPADLVIQGAVPGGPLGEPSKTRFRWPWGVWTDGEKLVVSSTGSGAVLIWNEFPTRDNQPADLLLTAGGKLGTPRTITSDGRSLIVGDHNARDQAASSGNFVWKSFPTTDEQPFDYFMTDPRGGAGWLQGAFTEEDKLVLLGSTLYIWDSLPEDENAPPELSLSDGLFVGGDGSDIAVAAGRLYISVTNGNRVLVFDSLPRQRRQRPDFAIGSPDVFTNTLETNFIISNPVPASNGESLFVASDFDHKLYVWKRLPDESGAHPDIVFSLPSPPWDIALWDGTLALAGGRTVYVWEELPLDGRLPDRTLSGRIGSVTLQELKGVALDDRYFYVADAGANRVYVWEGLPDEDSEPAFSLAIGQPWRLSSDGDYLAVDAVFEHAVLLYPVGDLGAGSEPVVVGGRGMFNLPSGATVAQGHLFVADTGFNRVHAWSRIEDALSGRPADVILGKENFEDRVPEIGRDKLSWPAASSFDGSYLWVGEFKFSERVLRFSPSP